jgi:lambda repressor-like predicted transcriptional regulator
MIAAYKSGTSMRELAKTFGCHRVTIGNKLKSAGIKLHGIPASKGQIDEMVRLYESRLSLANVGEQVGVSANTVLRHLRQQGIEIRNQGRQPK